MFDAGKESQNKGLRQWENEGPWVAEQHALGPRRSLLRSNAGSSGQRNTAAWLVGPTARSIDAALPAAPEFILHRLRKLRSSWLRHVNTSSLELEQGVARAP